MSQDTVFFTICARNYLAFAALLGRTVREQHPDASFVVWLLDPGRPGDLPDIAAGLDIRPVDEALAAAELDSLAFYYDILELATAVKPRCFQRLFADGAARVVYLDPDIALFRPLDELAERFDAGAPIVLTPHSMSPYPADDKKPDDLEILQSGIYNLGFLALTASREASELLEWWWGWLETACYQDKQRGTFTDQKWMNFAPLFWERASILRDPTYNVAYWNLDQRRLERDGAGFSIDGRPLAFFHFSGFDPEHPDVFSKHQTRHEVRRGEALAAILADYAERILTLGHRELRRIPIPVVAFDNGIPLDRVARHAYREALGQGMRFPRSRGNGVGSFYAWLGRAVYRDLEQGVAVPLTRYLMALYDMRPDVGQVFPDVYGADRRGFLQWVRDRATEEMGADPAMVERHLAGTALGTHRGHEDGAAEGPEASLTVNLAGYLRAALGIGEAARGYARAFAATGLGVRHVDCTALSQSPVDGDTGGMAFVDPVDADGAINVLHVNADQLPLFAQDAGPLFFDGRYTIGIWAWETLDFPEEWWDRFELVDEIWTGSGFMADAIGRVAPVPVLSVPHVVEVPDVAPDRARFGLPADETLFLFTFDFHSTPARKNPAGTLEAFRRAFRPDEPVRLVLKSINGRNRPDALAALRERAAGLRVTFLDEALSGEDRFRLLRSCDAFVSLHRAEGFGLGLAEAMAYGMPVIGTGWSGNMEFMDTANAYPVSFRLEPLEEADPPYAAGTLWAMPDLDHAAQLMRQVVDDPEQAQRIGANARRRIAEHHSAAAIGARARARLELIARRHGLAGLPGSGGSRAPVLQTSAEAQVRSVTYRSLRACWRLALRVSPKSLHPNLHRLSGRVRRTL